MNGKYLEEVLIRLGADGVKGAHKIYAVDMKNPLSGEVQTMVGLAEPIDLSTELRSVMDDVAQVALADNDNLRTKMSSLEQQNSVLQSELSAALSALDDMRKSLVNAKDELERLKSQFASQ